MNRHVLGLTFFGVALLLVTWSSMVFAQKAKVVPLEQQILLMLKVMGYDQGLSEKIEGTSSSVKIGVLFEKGHTASESCRLDAMEALNRASKQFNILGRRVEGKEVAFGEGLEGTLKENQVRALYFCTGIDEELPLALAATRKAQVLSFSGRKSDVSSGVSIGFYLEKIRPEIVVNLKSAREEGVNLSATFLRIANVINR